MEGVMMNVDRSAAITLLDTVATKLTAGSVEMALDQLFAGLEQLRQAWSWAEWRHFATVIAREHPLRELIHEDLFTRQAFAKPRGYPGDAALLDYVYAGMHGTALLPVGTSQLGRRIFTCTITTATCRAVRARCDLLAATVDAVAQRVRQPRILAVAAGHLREALRSSAFRDGAIGQWAALDQDAASLQVACQADPTGAVITPVTASIQALLRGTITVGTFDLIYAAGLYDYLSQPIAKKLTRQLFGLLRPGGRLLIGNVVTGMPGAGYMEAYMDWWLTYRTSHDMRDLMQGIPSSAVDSQRVFADQHQQISFLELLKADDLSSPCYRGQRPVACASARQMF
jgi:extracellular factor (EF) 3-hydroxypalmitic acid methyl ester biosynthesis protein